MTDKRGGFMYVEKQLNDLLTRLQVCANGLAEIHSQELWSRCETAEECLEGRFDEMTLSVLNRIAQESYYQAIDTMIAALRATLLEDDDDE